MVNNNEALSIEDAYFTNWKNYSMEFHKHACLEFNYVTKGTCIYYIGSKKYTLKKKNLLILNSSIPHKLVFSSQEPCLILGMAYDHVSEDSRLISLKNLFTAFPTVNAFFENFNSAKIIQDAHSIYPILQSVLKEFRGENNYTYHNILINKLLIDLSRLVLNDKQQSSDYVEMIKDYIQFNYFSINSINDIANYIGLNKVYMQRLFRTHTNQTVWNYLTNLRIKKAAYLLKYTDIPIGDIDENIGINSRQNFYRLFKKAYGISPLEYKKIHQKASYNIVNIN
jgi:AraC-type DNA-binding domain-containing proteins